MFSTVSHLWMLTLTLLYGLSATMNLLFEFKALSNLISTLDVNVYIELVTIAHCRVQKVQLRLCWMWNQ